MAGLVFSGTKINLTHTSSGSHSPWISIDSQERLVVVWVEEDWPLPGIADIFFMTKSGDTWTEGRETVSQLYDARSPQLVCGPSGIFHMVYDDGSNWSAEDIFYRFYSIEENRWSNIERVFNSYFISKHPKLRINSSGHLFVMWTRNLKQAPISKIVMSSRETGGLWPENNEFVSQNSENQADFCSFDVYQDNIHAAWLDNRSGVWEIYYNEKTGGSWGTPQKLTQGGGKSAPSLVADRKGGIHILFGSDQGNLTAMRREQNTWTAPVILSTGYVPPGPVDLVLHKNNTLHAVWVETHSTDSAVYYAQGTSEGTWLPPFKAAEGVNAENPRITLSETGQAHILWEDSGLSGNKDIFYTESIPSVVPPVAQIALSDETGIAPFTIECDASSSLPGEGEILSFWWEFGDGSPLEEGESISHTYTSSGNFTLKLYVTNTLLLCTREIKEVSILSGPFPPIDVQVAKVTDRGLFYVDRVNAVTWEINPKNTGKVSIDSYLIYRKLKTDGDENFKITGRVNSSTFRFADRDFITDDERDLYDYAVSAMDAQGREGPKQIAATMEEGAGGSGRQNRNQR